MEREDPGFESLYACSEHSWPNVVTGPDDQQSHGRATTNSESITNLTFSISLAAVSGDRQGPPADDGFVTSRKTNA